jgi:hypothetical protein
MRRAAVLAILCAGYVAAFVPANLTGAADVNMLAVFRIDEFGQFRTLWRMTTPSESTTEALYRFVAYDYYYYGFPFFAVSAVVFWPLRAIYEASGEPGLTTASALALRELSPLFTALAIGILVALWTRLRSLPHMVALFAFLAAMPAVVGNNLWWHPDGLLLFWIVATIAALSLDGRKLRGWFYTAAFACGLATATKTVGLWFFAAVALHLFRARSQLPISKLAIAAAGFAATMLLAIAAASPHYFLPSEWDEIFAAVSTWKRGIEVGWGTRGETGLAAWAPVVRDGFGWMTTWVVLLALGTLTALRAKRSEDRELAATILAWVIPLSAFLLIQVALQVERYLLPVLVPLASCAGSPLLWQELRVRGAFSRHRRLAAVAVAALLCAQLGFNFLQDLQLYRSVLYREEASPSLAFWERLDSEVLSRLPPEAKVRIFRDLYVYVPPDPRFETHVRWRSTEHADIEASNPDLVLLRRSQIDHLADPASLETSIDRDLALRAHRFHRDARDDSIPGYRQLIASDFAIAYGRVAVD